MHDGEVRGSSISRIQKNTWSWNFTPKKCLASKFSTQKNTRPGTSILIYSIRLQDLIRQTSRLKKIRDRSLDPKNYPGCKFSTQKNKLDLPVYCKYHPGANTPFWNDPSKLIGVFFLEILKSNKQNALHLFHCHSFYNLSWYNSYEINKRNSNAIGC